MEQIKDAARAVSRPPAPGREGFAKLLELHKRQVFSFLLRLVQNPSDAEDLAQETFLKAFRALPSYDAARPLLPWLLRIAHNAAVDFLRARKPQALSLDDEAALEAADPGPLPDRALDEELQRRLFERLLAALPALYREALLLRHQEGLEYKEIAQVLQLPEGTVKIRLFRARDMLRRKLEALGVRG